MAGRPKELFNPGELDRTRKNLGILSAAEAKRMAEILGGEIGIERTDEAINSRYRQLAEQNRRKHDTLVTRGVPRRDVIKERQKVSRPVIKTKPVENVKQPYFERIKMAVAANKSSYRIKSFSGVIGAFFSFLPGYKNRINPQFIKNINSAVYNHIERLVTSCRILYAGIENKDMCEKRNPYAWSIIRTIIEWDIETLEMEIKRLKSISYAVTVESCTGLIRRIYTPMILLSKVPHDPDIKDAVEYLYKQGISGLPEKHIKIPKLRKRYILAHNEIQSVFSEIKYNAYPLLLMRISPKAYSFTDMLKFQGKAILNFLDIGIDDLVKYTEPPPPENHDDGKDGLSEEKDGELEKEPPPLDIGISQGLFFLESIFPGSGWLKLKNNPDMFTYFQPLLDLNPDMALIAPEDILQKVIILTGILKELFFGFRSIKYGQLRDFSGNAVDLRTRMDEITDNWYHFLTTLIEKNYLTSLTEYARQLERDSTFPDSDYGKRIEADILWMRKKYIFPHTYLDTPKIMKPRINLSVPKLYEKTTVLRSILERMVLEIWNDEDMPVESVLNPEDEAQFEVESEVSKRLKLYYRRKGKPLLNKNLILSALHVVLVMDYLMNDRSSPVYSVEPAPLFRSEGNLGVIPVYSIKSGNPEDAGLFPGDADFDPDGETGEIDMLSGFPGSTALNSYLKRNIERSEETGLPFTVIRLETRDYRHENKREVLERLVAAVSDSIRQFEDIPLRISADRMYIILPETSVKDALTPVRRILEKTEETLPCFIAAAEFDSSWSPEDILEKVEETLELSKSFPAPMFTFINPETGAPEHPL